MRLWTVGSRAIRGGKGTGASSRRLRASLLATQIALSTVLLVGAGLLTRAISHAMVLDPEFAIAEVQELALKLPAGALAAAADRVRDALGMAGLPPRMYHLATNPTVGGKPPSEGRTTVSTARPGRSWPSPGKYMFMCADDPGDRKAVARDGDGLVPPVESHHELADLRLHFGQGPDRTSFAAHHASRQTAPNPRIAADPSLEHSHNLASMIVWGDRTH